MATRALQTWEEPASQLREPARKPMLVGSVGSMPRSNSDTAASLSDLEWSIVDMARSDGLSSLRQPGRLRKIIYAIFGLKPVNQLANARLEALRRVAVQAWRYRWNIAQEHLQALYSAGYSQDHFELIQRRIADARSARNRSKNK